MFDPQKDDYPQNAAGKPEFATAILHLDAISQTAPGDVVVHKMVFSTEDLISALVSLVGYFGEPEIFANPSNARLLVEAGRHSDPAFVYVTPREGTVLILTSTPTWDSLVQHPSFGATSSLLTMEKLAEIAASQLSQLQQMAGGFSRLLLLDFANIDEDAASNAPSGSSAGGPGSDAESLRDTAEVVEA